MDVLSAWQAAFAQSIEEARRPVGARLTYRHVSAGSGNRRQKSLIAVSVRKGSATLSQFNFSESTL